MLPPTHLSGPPYQRGQHRAVPLLSSTQDLYRFFFFFSTKRQICCKHASAAVCVRFIHEAVVKEEEVDFFYVFMFFFLGFFAYRREIWKLLNQIKPDLILSLFLLLFFGITNKKKNLKKSMRFHAVQGFSNTGLPRDKGLRFFCYCGDLNVIYGVTALV